MGMTCCACLLPNTLAMMSRMSPPPCVLNTRLRPPPETVLAVKRTCRLIKLYDCTIASMRPYSRFSVLRNSRWRTGREEKMSVSVTVVPTVRAVLERDSSAPDGEKVSTAASCWAAVLVTTVSLASAHRADSASPRKPKERTAVRSAKERSLLV